MLSYVQGGSVDIWKENILEDLKAEELDYATVEKFLADLKKKFGGDDDETIKVADLKKVEQENGIMEEFVQKFRKTAKRSRYKG